MTRPSDPIQESSSEESEDRWRKVESLWLGARDQPRAERTRWLQAQCGDDADLELEVQELLAAAEQTRDPLEGLVGEALASMINSDTLAGTEGLDSTVSAGPVDPHEDRSLIGTTIGYVHLEASLGRGGMGHVYRGVDSRLGRPVAFKVLTGKAMANPRLAPRLAREARLLSKLEHPGICRLYDIVVTPEVTGLVLELIEGRPLSAVIAEGFSDRRAVEMCLELAEALAAAHDAGVIHRDLKPANVMVKDDGTLKVLDFGIARSTAPETEAAQALGTATGGSADATRSGEMIGTLKYMSPEQFRGEFATAASDVFALGLVLYELLAGEPAYARERHGSRQLDAISHARIPSLTGLDKELNALLKRMTAAAPGSRPSAMDVAARLRSVLAAPKRRRRQRLRAVAIGALILVASVTSWLYYRVGKERSRAQQALNAAQLEADRANQQADTAREVRDVLIGVLEMADPWRADSVDAEQSLAARELFESAWRELLPDLELNPEVRSKLLIEVADLGVSLMMPEISLEAGREALAIRESLRGSEHPDVGEALAILSQAHSLAGELQEAETLGRRALRLLEPNRKDYLDAYFNLLVAQATLTLELGQLDVSEELARQLLEVSLIEFGAEHSNTESARCHLGTLLQYKALHDNNDDLLMEARQVLEANRIGVRALLGDDHPAMAMVLTSLGRVVLQEGDAETAETLFRQALEINRRHFGEQSWDAVQATYRLAIAVRESGRLQEADEIFRSVVPQLAALVDPDLFSLIGPLREWGRTLRLLGRLEEAEEKTRRALVAAESSLSADHWELLEIKIDLAQVLVDRGRLEEAETLVRSALAKNQGPETGLIESMGRQTLARLQQSGLSGRIRGSGEYHSP